ncbi:MAG: glycoside hydrolase family 113 [Phycisphaerae bacterium]
MKEKLLIFGLFVATVAGAIGFPLLFAGSEATETPRNDRPVKKFSGQQMRGFAIQMHNGESTHPYIDYIDEVAKTGANTVCLVAMGYQENCSSTSIFIESRKTPSADHLGRLIRHARKRGLKVVLMPIVLLENPRGGEWRGKINPTDWNDWWEDYTNFILYFAGVAHDNKAEVFMVGSELISTETQTEKWNQLIDKVRRRYTGLLSYSANWDHYKPVTFWDKLDIIGMTTYYDLAGGRKQHSLEALMGEWKPIKEKILAWQKKINRPILFTEVGWPNQATCVSQPWNYYGAQDKPAPKLQARCFEAFFETWKDEPAVAGYILWEWPSHPKHGKHPKYGYSGEDTSYVPKGKPAMKVISRYLTRDPNTAANTDENKNADTPEPEKETKTPSEG